MMKQRWRSLRSRILLLAVVTCLFLGIAAFSFLIFLRHSQAVSTSASERHLTTVAVELAQNYTDHAGVEESLRSVVARPDPLPPPPPREREPGHFHSPPPKPTPDPLAKLTATTLQRENGIEGGFYATSSRALVGYAFPTHEGPGPKKEMPQREKPTIQHLVEEAVMSGTSKSFRFEGPHDAVLFVATPIREPDTGTGTKSKSGSVTGAVWLMQRIPGFNGEQNRQLLLTSLGFGAAAIMTALLAFFVMTEIRGGVNTVLKRLHLLEGGLGKKQEDTSRRPLDEFQEVLEGIDKLAYSLDQKIAKEKTLEAELRHKERLSALGQFAAGVAHELRNPLATIRLRTQMSQRSASSPDIARNSTVVLEEIDRLNTMIERLLYFSRPISLHTEIVSLKELCGTVVAGWKERALPVTLTYDVEPEITLHCDRSRLVQILDNLIENAVESAGFRSGSAGTVDIRALAQGQSTVIEVFDNGQGFGAAALKHALDPFFTTRDNGTGLGLSIASELIQAHGGELQIKDRLEGGAVVSATFPSIVLQGADQLQREVAHG